MASIYCPECGAKNSYSLSKPNFCQGCGTKFGSLDAPKSGPKLKSSKANASVEEQDDDYIPDISKLEYDIEMSANKLTFENLVSNPVHPDDVKYPQHKKRGHKKMFKNKSDLENQSKIDCASSRNKPTDTGGPQ
tara:strand:- start:1965 stop:2366 length:402 start_codon:yes stop_codon:yes gene_type:complete